MYWDLVLAEHIGDYKVKVVFKDGKQGIVDLEHKLHGEVFSSLSSITEFSKFYIHPELCILTWPNGADLAPEFVYKQCV